MSEILSIVERGIQLLGIMLESIRSMSIAACFASGVGSL